MDLNNFKDLIEDALRDAIEFARESWVDPYDSKYWREQHKKYRQLLTEISK